VLADNLERILALPEDARVLDVGGWAAPLNRADWVIDVMPYETRGAILPSGFGPPPQRFGEETWVQRDICDHRPWPFEDDFFDFAVCVFTLEDLRDPIYVCREMSRVAKAGYVEVPSLLDELTWRNAQPSGGPWAGHEHHRWLCAYEDGELVFLPKFHSVHSRARLRVPPRWSARLSLEELHLAFFWEGELRASERLAIDHYPFDELERAIRGRFAPSGLSLWVRELPERLRGVAARAGRRFR
jgi:SAM-dependent methyltransferase